jgi:hypothetical protein
MVGLVLDKIDPWAALVAAPVIVVQREKSKKPVKTKRFNDFSTLHRLPGSV